MIRARWTWARRARAWRACSAAVGRGERRRAGDRTAGYGPGVNRRPRDGGRHRIGLAGRPRQPRPHVVILTREDIARLPVSTPDRRAAADAERRGARARPARRAGGLRDPRRRLRPGAGAGQRRPPQRRPVGPSQRRHPRVAARRRARRGAARRRLVAARRRRVRRHHQRHHAARRRRASSPTSPGQHDLVEAAAVGEPGGAARRARVRGRVQPLVRLHAGRDHDVKLARYQGTLGARTTLSLAYLDKEFGANGFYGPVAVARMDRSDAGRAEQRFAPRGSCAALVDGAYRAHGDRFVYDWRQPALSDNHHRTARRRRPRPLAHRARRGDAAVARRDGRPRRHRLDRPGRAHVLARRRRRRAAAGGRLAAGGAARPAGRSLQPLRHGVEPVDRGERVDRAERAVAHGGRPRFRVPTFTELYYRDPNHQAAANCRPSAPGRPTPASTPSPAGWTASADRVRPLGVDVIDWVRAVPTERWQTTNIRDVDTRGVELGLPRRVGAARGRALHRPARRRRRRSRCSRSTCSTSRRTRWPRPGATTWRRVDLGSRVAYNRRADGRDYWVVDTRVAHPVGRARSTRTWPTLDTAIRKSRASTCRDAG